MNRRSEIVLDKIFLFAAPETAENQNWLAHAKLAQFDSFSGRSHAKPIRARFLQRLGNLRPPVAVAIALDDAQNFAGSLSFFRRRIHVVANGAIVLRERFKRNFRPNGPADEIDGIFLPAGHEFSRKI